MLRTRSALVDGSVTEWTVHCRAAAPRANDIAVLFWTGGTAARETQPLPAWDIHTHTHIQPYIRTYMHVHTTYIYPAVNSKYVREVHSDELSRANTISPAFSVRTSYKADVAGETPRIPSIYQIFSYSIRDCCSVLFLSFSSLSHFYSLSLCRAVFGLSRSTADTKGYWDL